MAIRTPVVLDIDRYWWIIRPAGGAGEVCRIRRDDADAEGTVNDVRHALDAAASAQAVVDAAAPPQAMVDATARLAAVAAEALSICDRLTRSIDEVTARGGDCPLCGWSDAHHETCPYLEMRSVLGKAGVAK